MAEQQRQSLCPRLIDYLTIVGARSHSVGRSGVGPNPPIQAGLELKENLSSGAPWPYGYPYPYDPSLAPYAFNRFSQ